MYDDVEYLCFEGAAGHGLLYIGALMALHEMGTLKKGLKGCVGSSSGALTAFVVCSGIELSDLQEMLQKMHGWNLAEQMDIAMLINKYGMDTGKKLVQLVEEVMNTCGISHRSTFSDFHRLTKKHFACTVTDMSSCDCIFMDHINTPTASILDAVTASMSIPFVYTPCTKEEVMYTDGGMSNNIPFGFFPHRQTLVFCIKTHTFEKVESWNTFLHSIIRCNTHKQRIEVNEKIKNLNCEHLLLELETLCSNEDLFSVNTDNVLYGYIQMLNKLMPEVQMFVRNLLLCLIARFSICLQADETV